jgi:NADH-quinone oxidoreductase subunit K
MYEPNKENIVGHFFDLVEKGQTISIPLWIDYVFLFYLLFLIGLTGIIFNYKNYLVTMFCIELMYLGITICFIIISISTADPKGQIYAVLLLVLAAAESAIGLGVLIVLYRFGNSIEFQDYQELKG